MGNSASSSAKEAAKSEVGSAEPKPATRGVSGQVKEAQSKAIISQPSLPPRGIPQISAERQVSAERLKRLALNQKGYHDEHRDYDAAAAVRNARNDMQIRGNLVVASSKHVSADVATNAPRNSSQSSAEGEFKTYSAQGQNSRAQPYQSATASMIRPPRADTAPQDEEAPRFRVWAAAGGSPTQQPAVSVYPVAGRPPPPRRPGMTTQQVPNDNGGGIVYAPSDVPLPTAAMLNAPMMQTYDPRASLQQPSTTNTASQMRNRGTVLTEAARNTSASTHGNDTSASTNANADSGLGTSTGFVDWNLSSAARVHIGGPGAVRVPGELSTQDMNVPEYGLRRRASGVSPAAPSDRPSSVMVTTILQPPGQPTVRGARVATGHGGPVQNFSTPAASGGYPARSAQGFTPGPPISQPPGLPRGLSVPTGPRQPADSSQSGQESESVEDLLEANFTDDMIALHEKPRPSFVPALTFPPSGSPKIPGRDVGGSFEQLSAGPAHSTSSSIKSSTTAHPHPPPMLPTMQTFMGPNLGLHIVTNSSDPNYAGPSPANGRRYPGMNSAVAAAANIMASTSMQGTHVSTVGATANNFAPTLLSRPGPSTGAIMMTAPTGPGGGPGANAAMTINPTARSRIAKPPTPVGAAQFTVKETKDVKRNKASLPSEIRHAKPTGGDWLKKRYIVNNYILLDTLGAGSYGEVRLCKDRVTDHLYAMKIISRDLLKKRKGGKSNETFVDDIMREIAIMKKLQHPNVLRLYEVLDDDKVNKMYLVLEYMKKGDLINILKAREGGSKEQATAGVNHGSLSDVELWHIFRQVVAGIRYLHYQNIVHGDIKPQNLLVSEDGIVKIADFGISRMLENNEQTLTNAAGTPAFMSPELCSGGAFSGQLADVWALGATMFMLKFGHPPFVASSVILLYHKIQTDPLVLPYAIDHSLQDLLQGMMDKDPSKRFTLMKVATHPWLRAQPPPPATPKAATSSSSSAAAMTPSHGQRRGSSPASILFHPPPTYDKEEKDAMEGGIKTVDHEDMFRSIGSTMLDTRAAAKMGKSRAKILASKGRTTSDSTDATNDDEVGEDNIMSSNWGADVFGIVDDEGIDSSDDDDDDDDDVDGQDAAAVRDAASARVGQVLDAVAEIVDQEVDVEDSDSDDDDVDELDAPSPMKQTSSSATAGVSSQIASSSTPINVKVPIKNVRSVVSLSDSEGEENDVRDVDDDAISKGSSSTTGKNTFSRHSMMNGELTAEGSSSSSPMVTGAGAVNGDAAAGAKPAATIRTEMSAEELESRAKRFKNAQAKKSMEHIIAKPDDQSPLNQGRRGSNGLASARIAGLANMRRRSSGSVNVSRAASPSELNLSGAYRPDAISLDSTRPNPSKRGAKLTAMDSTTLPTPDRARRGGFNSSRMTTPDNARDNRFSPVDEDEFTETVTMETFAEIMDTLAMQPPPSNTHDEEYSPIDATLKTDALFCQQRNNANNVGAALYSDRGDRPHQEDRCLFVPDMSSVYTTGDVLDHRGKIIAPGKGRQEFFAHEIDPVKVDAFRKFSLACIFDGHSGSMCSEYVYRNFAQTLIAHPKVLDKSPEPALFDVFAQIERSVCSVLLADDDRSGSTAVVALFDGRRHVLTIASIGDSLCILSRGGRAVKMHRSHRLKDNPEECVRVRAAGGIVKNDRVHGMLAISRAFGDTHLKEIGEEMGGPVIAIPEICSEVVTPLTEFCVLGSDGLWDIMEPQLVVNFVRKKLSQKSDLQECARELVKEALHRGSVDNVTALIMTFHVQPNQAVAAKSS